MSGTPFVKFIFFVSILSILFACSVEQKIATGFISKNNKAAVLVLSPEIIYKTNLKDSLIGNNDSLSQIKIDSILIENSLYLKHLNADAFIGNSLNHLKDELVRMGFRVFDETSLDQFMQTKDSSYILKLAQVEIEEGYGKRLHTDYLFGENVDVEVNVNFLNINSWFEFERKNLEKEVFPLLYSSFSLMDDVQGDFVSDGSGQVNYIYAIDTLSLKDFASAPEILGKKYAGYFYDYILNVFVLEQLPSGKAPAYFYHYNPQNKKVSPLWNTDDHFIEIE